MDTLVLNRDGLPLGVVPLSTLHWQEAVKLMFVERVDIVAEYEDWLVHSPSTILKVPSVMILRDYVRLDRAVKFSRANVILRDEYRCQYCGKDFSHNHSALTMDHVTPRARGGKTNWTNIVAACWPCNLSKAHYETMKPLIPAWKPNYYQLVAKRKKFPIEVPHESWVSFLNWDDESNVLIRPNRRNKSE